MDKESARLLAQYVRKDDHKYRSTKQEEMMATLGGNRSISHREKFDDLEDKESTVLDHTAACLGEAKRRFT